MLTVTDPARPEPKSASRSLRRALLMPQINPGSLYRRGKRFEEQPAGYGRREGGAEIRPTRFSQVTHAKGTALAAVFKAPEDRPTLRIACSARAHAVRRDVATWLEAHVEPPSARPAGAGCATHAGTARPQAKSASRSSRRALLTPRVNPGSLYRCGKRT